MTDSTFWSIPEEKKVETALCSLCQLTLSPTQSQIQYNDGGKDQYHTHCHVYAFSVRTPVPKDQRKAQLVEAREIKTAVELHTSTHKME